VVRFSLINLLYGLRGHIDNMAHLGGLVTGLAAGLFLARSFSLAEEDRGARRRTVIAVTAIVVALMVIPIAKAKSYAVELNKGKELLNHNDYDGAIEHLKKYTAAQPDDPYGHALLGSALQGTKRFDEAVNEYERGLALAPDYHYIQVNLAHIYVYQDKPEKAVQLFAKSITHVTADGDDYYDYAVALQATGNLAEAERAARRAVGLKNSPEARSLLDQIVQAEGDAAARVKKEAKDPNRKVPGDREPASR
jgi:Flp pilus assembly protein TadD